MTSIVPREVTVEDLPFYSVHMPSHALGADIARLFEQNPALPGVIVMDNNQFLGLVARNQFFQRLGRLFGIEIYSTRPITSYLDSLKEAPFVLPNTTPIQAAAVACLARSSENVYNPFIVTMPNRPPRLVDFLALILKQTELLAHTQAEAQAQREIAVAANNAKSEFLANMSHELRTPLTAVIGYGEILIEDAELAGQPEMVPRLKNIISAGHHLLEMINGVLDLSKVEAGQMQIFLETENLAPLVHEIAGTIHPLMNKNGNELTLFCDDSLGEITTDVTKLRQCLYNLLSNASKFTHQGQVNLYVNKETVEGRDWAVFHVQDTGIGMNPEQMARLFEAFYQADSSISRRYGGTGLGLNLTKRFCEMLGGSLTVVSEVGKGTVFTMTLPLRSVDPQENGAPA